MLPNVQRGRASNKSPTFKQIRSESKIQDGEHFTSERHFETKQFSHQNRLKRCFLQHPYCQKVKKIPSVYLPQQTLPILRPTIWNFNSSSSVFQDPKACYALLRTRGISLIIYLDDLLIATGTYIDCLNHTKQVISLLESLGFRINYEKSIIIPTQKLEFLGFIIDSTSVSRPPSRENPVNKIVSLKASENKRNHFNKTALKIHRSLHFSKIRCSPSTSTLLITSVPEKLCFTRLPILPHSVQSRGSPEPRSHNRPKVVGRPPAVSQQNTNSYKRPRSYHHIGCLRSGLGSMVQGKISSRPMVSGGNVLAYKPKGASSCIFGSKNILPISNKSVVPHSTSNRQSGSCFIYKSSGGEGGGNTLKTSLPIKSGSVELVPIKTDPYLCKVYPRYLQQTCRSCVKKVKANCRMEVEPYSVPKDCCSLRDATNRFFCDKSRHSAQKVCVMDTRLSECCNRHVQCPVVRPTVLCVSSLQSDHEMCAKDKKSERENFASNPSMEIQTLVPLPVFSPIRSTPTSSEFRDYTTSPIQPEGLEAQTEHKQVDSSCLAAVRQCFSKYQVSERVSKIIFASWSSGTESQYKSCWGFILNFVLEFLTVLFYQNYQYRTINVYWSTISGSHLPVNGSPIGSHPLISHFMKGIFELRPPQPRLFTIWSVMTVLKYLKSLSPPEDLNLKQLTLKVVMLSALVSAARCSFLHQMDLNFSYFRNDGYVFFVPGLVEESKPHKSHLEIFLPSFPPDASLCVASYLKRYIDVTSSKRNNSSSRNFLFISYIKPHKAVKTSSISRWLKNALRLSGIDTSQFSAHSTRSASSTLAANCGVSISDIMKVADWSRTGTLKKFYQRPILDSYAHRILSSASSIGNPQSHDGENENDRG